MKNLTPTKLCLKTSLEQLQLNYLLKEIYFYLNFLEKSIKIQKYFLDKTTREKPFRIFKKNYHRWIIKIQELENNYQNSLQVYIEECEYLDIIMEYFIK